ncbi:MAG: YdcF family protein [Kiritimatiellae bacterium]|nr:YdcF family protein [Kiritimatiellia bacterium]
MYVLNKIVWFFLNPLTLPLLGAVVGGVLLVRKNPWRRLGGSLLFLSLAILWFESTQACLSVVGRTLERPYLPTQAVESLPSADAVVILGGGMGKNEDMAYPDMYEAADRVWHAARLWKAGKAPIVVASGTGEMEATVPLLLDFGVPREAIVVDDKSRNTYENSRFTERLLLERAGSSTNAAPSVLLVTSAWHMPRACGNFAKTSLRVVPAAADFSASNARPRHWWDWVAPGADTLMRNNYCFKEWLGRLARK